MWRKKKVEREVWYIKGATEKWGLSVRVCVVFMSLEGKPPMYEEYFFQKNKKSKIQSQTKNQLQFSP
jgi:hypothetical protein